MSQRIAIIGGGIAGLATAYYAQEAGLEPVIYEASDHLGGLGAHFEHEGVTLDRYYHVILDSDADLCRLLGDIGLADRLVWRETGMGFLVDGVLYPFNTPLDLLRFRALGLIDRLRTGFGALYITSVKKQALDLDRVPARTWLQKLFGPRVFSRIWDPLLRAKFGERRDGVPAYWIWNTLNREKNGGQEVKGYVRGGYRIITETLRDRVLARGGRIVMQAPVEWLEADGAGARLSVGGREESFDAVVSTLPMGLLGRVARGPLQQRLPSAGLQYQGCVNVLLQLKRSLSPFYWTAVVDPLFPFQGVVETTRVIPTEWTGGHHLVYVMNYCAADTETYARSDELLRQQAVDGLARLYPRFSAADVHAVHVFRAPAVEPVWTVGYLDQRPGVRIADTKAYLCTTAQAYPRVTAWNTSVGLARETVTALAADLRVPRAAAAA